MDGKIKVVLRLSDAINSILTSGKLKIHNLGHLDRHREHFSNV